MTAQVCCAPAVIEVTPVMLPLAPDAPARTITGILDDVFVPDHRTLTYKDLASGQTPGGAINDMTMAKAR